MKVLQNRYLVKDNQGKVIENPTEMFWRVAKNLAKAEEKRGAGHLEVLNTANEFYDLMTSLKFLPNAPTLYNAGTQMQQLSACFVLPIEDSIESIYDALKYQAIIHASGGGTGFSFSKLRPRGSMVQSTKGIASGPISFLKVFNASTEEIKQGGKRRGANMGILRVDHPDILEFIQCKTKDGNITNFNISVAITDSFMKAVKEDKEYDLIDPNTKKVVDTKRAKEVWDELIESAWVGGDPGVIFFDTVNKENPTPEVGEIESTNPCGEVPLLPYESCNLGSLVLPKYLKEKEIQWNELEKDIRTAVQLLDNVIDMNKYPIPHIEQATRFGNRKIGLGVMGWAELLYQLEIPYNSEEAISLANDLMKFIKTCADSKSKELAEKIAPYANYHRKKEGDPNRYRNATRLSIAPTGEISMIAETSAGIEPVFSLCYIKRVMDGKELLYTNDTFKRVAIEKGFYSEELMRKVANASTIQHMEEIPEEVKKVFVVAHDISPYWHTRMQAAFQEHVDLAVSKTVNFPNDATVKDVEEVYKLAYDLGCKGVTIYRDGSRSEQVLNLTKTSEEGNIVTNEPIKDSLCETCNGKLVMQEGCATCPNCSTSLCTV